MYRNVCVYKGKIKYNSHTCKPFSLGCKLGKKDKLKHKNPFDFI